MTTAPQTSHPTRVRGLKLPHRGILPVPAVVAPHAGAGIETGYFVPSGQLLFVAPHAGAWIETSGAPSCPAEWEKSHPTRVRGLKQNEHV